MTIRWRNAEPIPIQGRMIIEEALSDFIPAKGTVVTSVFPYRRRTAKAVDLIKAMTRRNYTEYTLKSVYGYVPPLENQFNVWFTGENLRPPHDYDLTLSFDLDDFNGKNIYLPLALVEARIQSLNAATRAETSRILASSRPGDVAAFVGNPHPYRMRALVELARFLKVDVFGAAVGRPVHDFYQTAARYKTVLCFENDYFPGYVTEKPVRAWAAGAIPLWWGADEGAVLNQSALIDASQLSMQQFVDAVRELINDAARLDAMQQEAIISSDRFWWPS